MKKYDFSKIEHQNEFKNIPNKDAQKRLINKAEEEAILINKLVGENGNEKDVDSAIQLAEEKRKLDKEIEEERRSPFGVRLNKILESRPSNDISRDINFKLYKLNLLSADIVEKYKTKHSLEESTGKELEDKAYKAYSLADITEILEKVQSQRDLWIECEERAGDVRHLPYVVTPTGPGPETIPGLEERINEPEIKDRVTTLKFVLREDGLAWNQIEDSDGEVPSEQLRRLSYHSIVVPEKNRVFLVCDEEENASYVFDTKKMESLDVSIQDINKMSKQTMNDFIDNNPGIGLRFKEGNNWFMRIKELLSKELPIRELPVEDASQVETRMKKEINFDDPYVINALRDSILIKFNQDPTKPLEIIAGEFENSEFDYDGKKITGRQIRYHFYQFLFPEAKNLEFQKNYTNSFNYKKLLDQLSIKNDVEVREKIEINFNDPYIINSLRDSILTKFKHDPAKPFEIGAAKFMQAEFDCGGQKINGTQILYRFYKFLFPKETTKNVISNSHNYKHYKKLLDELSIKNNIEIAEKTEIDFNDPYAMDALRDSILANSKQDPIQPLGIRLDDFSETEFDCGGKKINGDQILIQFYKYNFKEKTGRRPTGQETMKNSRRIDSLRDLLDYFDIKNKALINFDDPYVFSSLKKSILDITGHDLTKPPRMSKHEFQQSEFDFSGEKVNGIQILRQFYKYNFKKGTNKEPTYSEVTKNHHLLSNYKDLMDRLGK